MERTTKNKHFVLVHGACLGAWSWYKVVTKLKSGGHKVTALDMAASGINTKRLEDVHSFMDYVEPLMEFMEALPPGERVILVGHSYGGILISLAMERFPHKIGVAVFIASSMPCLGIDMGNITEKYKRPLDFYMDSKVVYGEDHQVGSVLFGPKFMSVRMFQLCPPEVGEAIICGLDSIFYSSSTEITDVELALVLVRPVPAPLDEKTLQKDPNALTKENYGSVRRVYIKLEDDNLINKPIEEFRLNNYPPEELKIIHNADHIGMLSNPQDLSSCLLEISQKYD